jgi:hypothetical protein
MVEKQLTKVELKQIVSKTSESKDQELNQKNKCIKKIEIFTIIRILCLMIYQMSTCILLVFHAHGLFIFF